MVSEFDKRSKQFTEILDYCKQWKHNFFGAAYSTRIKQAIGTLRVELESVEKWMRDNGEWP